MTTHTTSTVRRFAAVAMTIALVAGAAASGVGAAAASAVDRANSTVGPQQTDASATPDAAPETETGTTPPSGPTADVADATPSSRPTPGRPTGQSGQSGPTGATGQIGPTATTAPAATATPEPAATPAPTAGTGADTTPAPAPAAALAFTEASSTEAPIELEATAGQPFSHTFATAGGPADTPVRYEVLRTDGKPFPTSDIGAAFPSGIALDAQTGVLGGTTTDAGWSSFLVVATSGDQRAVATVTLHVGPGTATGLELTVALVDDPEARTWTVAPDGSITAVWVPQDGGTQIRTSSDRAVTVQQGASIDVRGAVVDRWGNYAEALEPAEGEWVAPGVTSDVPSDVVTAGPVVTRVTFPHASTHTLVATKRDLDRSFRVTVVPVPAGSLAFTGAETAAPTAWALGLLSAGGALLVCRQRRRRV